MEAQTLPPQHQDAQPGVESELDPQPQYLRDSYRGSGKLEGKTALITGGDSGIGRSVALHFAMEGAKVAIAYFSKRESGDAQTTKSLIEENGGACILMQGDLKEEAFCREIVEKTVAEFGSLDVLVNNAAMQFPQEEVDEVSHEQMEKTFRTNIFPMFDTIRAALPHLKPGASIINTASITAYEGSPELIDYSSTKGAIVSLTRSLAAKLVSKGIRVNGVAPGPIWTPLIASSFDAGHVSKFGSDTPMKRPGQPCEVAPAYVYLACNDSSYVTGQMIHVNGGTPVGG